MPKKMLIDATHPEETRVVVADGNKVEDFDFESINKRQLAGNIYLAKVTRVEPSLQAAFVEYGGNRHGFLAFPEIHPDYYQIPVADREALLAEEEREARADAVAEEEADRGGKKPRRARKSKAKDDAPEAEAEGTSKRRSSRSRRAKSEDGDAGEAGSKPRKRRSGKAAAGVAGLEVIDLDATPAPVAEEPAAVPKGLEIADHGGAPAPAAEAPAEEAAEAADEAVSDASDAEAAETPVAEPVAEAEAEEASAEAAETPEAEETAPDDTDTAAGASDEDDTPPAGPKSVAESTGLDDEVVSEDVAVAEPAADTAEATADAPAEAAAEPAAETPKEGRKSRSRGGKSRRSRKPKSEDTEDETAEAGAEAQEIEQSGADDPREEIQDRERAMRRRRYKIQDVIKVRQILLVQVVKEERGNKGAALTTYLSLAGRYCVLMPNTARGGGISRKITNATDRKRLREVVDGLDVPKGMGLIVRTAGAERTKPEIKRDYEFLLRQWEQIRALTLKSIAPCLIYEEGSLIKRSIRDIYSKDIEQVLVEGDAGYREAKDYMKMLTPSHAKNVQQYADTIPLFIRYQVESYLAGMFNPTVQLKSGGYIVIGITEALVAIDVNSGRSTKEGSVEDTALKTNLEAADEVARQLRLRDLAGLIVIDFIDMDENRNNRAVEKRMKERLKTDRARIQIGRISAFGLMEMSRQRLRPGMLEASTKPCPHCHGTGMIRSDESLALAILREVEEEAVRGRLAEVTVTAPVNIANFLINSKRSHIARIEERHSIRVAVLGDAQMANPEYKLDRVKGQARDQDKDASTAVITASRTMAEPEEVVEPAQPAKQSAPRAQPTEDGDGARGEDGNKRRRRGKRGGRRRRGRGEEAMADGQGQTSEASAELSPEQSADEPAAETSDAGVPPDAAVAEGAVAAETVTEAPADAEPVEAAPTEIAEADAAPAEEPKAEAPAKPARKPRAPRKSRAKAKAAAEAKAEDAPAAEPEGAATPAVAEEPPAPQSEEAVSAHPEATANGPDPVAEPEPEPETPAEAPAEAAAETPADDDKPKRRGWWSFGF
ncbi:MAG: Rne/Rng family ribonuclease [Pseudomonadota bacterium]